MAYKTYITVIYTQLVLKLSKKNLCSFKTTDDTADKGKLYSICSTPELSERNFCDALEI